MSQHDERAHAPWSPSASERNWNCSGALAYCEGASSENNVYAATGTVCHQLAEECLRAGVLADDAIVDEVIHSGGFKVTVTEDMVGWVNEYVDYVLSLQGPHTSCWLETTVSLGALGLPVPCFGTVDAQVYNSHTRTLHVIDAKFGWGWVPAKNNKQLRTYALGSILGRPELPVDQIITTIVQPAAGRDPASDTLTPGELALWAVELMAAVNRSAEAKAAFTELPWDVWAAKYLNAGTHCLYCPRAAVCPVLRSTALGMARTEYSELTPMQMGELLDKADVMGTWLKGLRGYAQGKAEIGVEIPGYMLAQKKGHRAWIDVPGAGMVLPALTGLSDEQLYTQKLRSPAQIDKLLPKKSKDLIADLWEAPLAGSYLTRADPSKPAAQPQINQWFEQPTT